MDTYDIFKRISQGAKFTRKPQTNKFNLNSLIKVDQIKSEPEDSINPITKEQQDEFTLLSSMKVSQGNKKRKRDRDTSPSETRKKKLQEEKVNQYRNEMNISVVGRHIPEPFKKFEDLSIRHPNLLENIAKCGYLEPTPIQKQAIPIMLFNRQMLACAPTGSG